MIGNHQQHGLATLSTVGTVDFYFYVGEAGTHPKSIANFSGSELNNGVTRISNEWIGQTLTPAERSTPWNRKLWL